MIRNHLKIVLFERWKTKSKLNSFREQFCKLLGRIIIKSMKKEIIGKINLNRIVQARLLKSIRIKMFLNLSTCNTKIAFDSKYLQLNRTNRLISSFVLKCYFHLHKIRVYSQVCKRIIKSQSSQSTALLNCFQKKYYNSETACNKKNRTKVNRL